MTVEHSTHRRFRLVAAVTVMICALALGGCGFTGDSSHAESDGNAPSPTTLPSPSPGGSSPGGSSASSDLHRAAVPGVDNSPGAQAQRTIRHLSVAQQIGQLVMAPLPAGHAASGLQNLITNRYVGSVLITGNWNTGIPSVRQATATLQNYAPTNLGLLTATDQEGGEVQHLRGAGFTAMPSAVAQGTMSFERLRSNAAIWGAQLNQAGINVNLAPVTDTVQGNRASNAPIGALNRDFGLDASGNAAHAEAFIDGMRDAGVQSVIKHYPGLGAVTGNTDFTTQGIEDDTTTLGSPQIGAFTTALQAHPAMVMMSLATYAAIDRSQPAAFSSTLISGQLRGESGYQGVVISDSLSATALNGTATDQLGVRLIEAGGDMACISVLDDVGPVLDGLNAKAAGDPAFAAKVRQSAIRVLTLKYQMGLAH